LLLSAAAAVVERRPVVVQLAAFVVVAAVASFLERQVHWHIVAAAAAVVERRPVVVQLAAFVVVAAVASFLERQVHWHIVAAAAVAVAVAAAAAVVVVVDTSSPARDFAVAVHIECVALVSKMVQEPQEPEPLASFEVALELEERVVEHPVQQEASGEEEAVPVEFAWVLFIYLYIFVLNLNNCRFPIQFNSIIFLLPHNLYFCLR
jgi:hypothetical protein